MRGNQSNRRRSSVYLLSRITIFWFFQLSSNNVTTYGFTIRIDKDKLTSSLWTGLGAKRGGGGGFGTAPSPSTKKGAGGSSGNSKSNAASKKGNTKAAKEAKRVLDAYGGDIQKGTMERIRAARERIQVENPPLAMAMTLTEEESRWVRSTQGLDLLRQAEIPKAAWEAAEERQRLLARLHSDAGVGPREVHNAFQKLTWDASAEAKGLRTDMSDDISTKLRRTAELAAEARTKGMVLDVGCGTGALLGELLQVGVPPGRIRGVDLSPEMVRVASAKHPKVGALECADFFDLNSNNENDDSYDVVVFCMSLHDLPDPTAALRHAIVGLGARRVVVSHPRGGSHVTMQHQRNPLMVPHLLPTAGELDDLCASLQKEILMEERSVSVVVELTIRPSTPGTPEDKADGYLAVIDMMESQ